MFLTASSDNMQLDASCLSLFLLSLRRKPGMLKGTLCSGEKPQQFVLWFLDKSSSEKSFPRMCSVSMAVFTSQCVCLGVFSLFCVCVIKFTFIRCTFWSLPSWCHQLWLAETRSKCFLGVQVNCLQMGMQKFGWNLSLGLVTKWGQICYCSWEISTENLAKKVLILIPPLWPSSANQSFS